jgi:hypothetical protein
VAAGDAPARDNHVGADAGCPTFRAFRKVGREPPQAFLFQHTNHVGADVTVCPAEQSSAVLDPRARSITQCGRPALHGRVSER